MIDEPPHSPHRWRARAAVHLAALTAALLTAGCRPPEAPRPPSGHEPLSLRSAPEAVSLEQPRVLETLSLEPGGLVTREGSIEPLDGEDAGFTVRPGSEGLTASLTLAHSFEVDPVREVRLLLSGRGKVAVQLGLGTRRKPRGDLVWLRGSGEVEVLSFPIPADVPPGTLFDGLGLKLRFHANQPLELREVRVLGVELRTRPPGAELATAEEGPRPIEVGSEGRSGIGLTADRPVLANLPGDGPALLRFAWRPASSLRATEAPTRLVLRLRSKELDEVHALEAPVPAPDGWLEAEVELTGGEVEARWELEDGGAGTTVALAEVRLHRPGAPVGPRVLLITSDTHRFDHLGLAGRGVEIDTPVIDALAAEGLFFEDFYSSTNVTNPSHMALMTGIGPRDHGVFANNERISGAARTLAEVFRAAGFRTFATVSIRQLSDVRSGLGQGFDRISAPSERPERGAEDSVRILKEWLGTLTNEPAFAWLHLFDAHTPYRGERDLLERYYPEPQRAFDTSRELVEPIPAKQLSKLPDGLRDLDLMRALYRTEISVLDRELASLLDLPQLEEAVVAFTADHGESLGEHGIFFDHGGLYPQSLHIPLVLRFPGSGAGERITTPVHQLDLGRTLLDLAGLAGEDFPGRNLLEESASSEDGRERPRFAIGANRRCASITHEGWLLVLWLEQGRMHARSYRRHAVELYDLGTDPDCERDLVGAEPERARRLRTELVRWLADRRDLGLAGERLEDSETLADLEALGYTAATGSREAAAPLYDPACRCRLCAPWR